MAEQMPGKSQVNHHSKFKALLPWKFWGKEFTSLRWKLNIAIAVKAGETYLLYIIVKMWQTQKN